jgi:amino acid transporter
LTKPEVVRYNFYHIRWLILLDLIGLGLFLYIVYASYSNPVPETRQLLRTVSIWAAIALAIGLSQPFLIILQVYLSKAGKSESLMGKRLYRFSDFGIQISARGKNASKKWEDVKKIKNIGNILLIFTAPKLAYVIPRRCLGSKGEWGGFLKFTLGKVGRKK